LTLQLAHKDLQFSPPQGVRERETDRQRQRQGQRQRDRIFKVVKALSEIWEEAELLGSVGI